jgi:hypothetical protein
MDEFWHNACVKIRLSICNLFIDVKSLPFSRILFIINSHDCNTVLILCFMCVLLKCPG